MKLALAILALALPAIFVGWLLLRAADMDAEPVRVVTVEAVPVTPGIFDAMFPLPSTTTTTTAHVHPQPRYTPRTTAPIVMGTGACGGDLPPCWVLARESGGNINAYNPTGCYERKTGHRGCRGKWQCSYSTCSGTGTEEEQDAEARALWNGGAGCAHWNACGRTA